jgi:DNA-binding HxlR family transcriptional regulator
MMRRKALGSMGCSIAKALDVVGDPWTLLILRDALVGVTRFADFSDRLGIPRATLTSRLDLLCESGVMQRESYQDNPPRSAYVLTDKGRALSPVVISLMQWGDQWLRDDAPPTSLVDADTGKPIDPVLVDRATGVPLEELAVAAVGAVTQGLGSNGHAPVAAPPKASGADPSGSAPRSL